jgi:hypothetical protein
MISTVPDQLTVPNRPTPPLSFTVSDFETPASNLWSPPGRHNTNVVAPAGLVLGGVGTNRTITVQNNRLTNQAGTGLYISVRHRRRWPGQPPLVLMSWSKCSLTRPRVCLR